MRLFFLRLMRVTILLYNQHLMAKLPNIVTKKRSVPKLFWWITKIAWKHSPGAFIGLIVFGLIPVLMGFANSYSFAQILTILSQPNPTITKIVPYLVLVLAFDYFPGVLYFIRSSFEEYILRKLSNVFEQMTLQKLDSLDIATIEQPDFQDLLYQARSRGENSMLTIFRWLEMIMRDTTRVVVALTIILVYTKIGLLIILLTTAPVYIYEAWRSKRLGKLWTVRSEANRKAGTKLSVFTTKSSLLEVKFLGIPKLFMEKIKAIRTEHHDAFTEDDVKTGPVYAASSLLPSAGIAASIILVLRDVLGGIRPLGALSFVWGSVWSFSSSLQSILRSIGRLEEQAVHANKLIDVLETEGYVEPNVGGIQYEVGVPPTIELQNVSFTYPGTERTILKNLSCVFGAGEEIALVGLNGAGKTTLLRLLTRVYDPTEGVILVNGIPLPEYNLYSWRDALSVMMQDYAVYSDESIKENILAGKVENAEFLERVTKESGVAEYASSYEKGLDQMIGREFHGGVELSKGQNQKLVLARVLYRNTPAIILDEPTAAVDALSEDYIFKALRDNYKNKTRVIISHKFSNVRDADKIILIQDGTVLEQGTHEKLMKIKKGKYKELFELQAEGYR